MFPNSGYPVNILAQDVRITNLSCISIVALAAEDYRVVLADSLFVLDDGDFSTHVTLSHTFKAVCLKEVEKRTYYLLTFYLLAAPQGQIYFKPETLKAR